VDPSQVGALSKPYRPPWWFIVTAVTAALAVGAVLGLICADAVTAHTEITQLRTQVCQYQQIALALIRYLEQHGHPVPGNFPVTPVKGCNFG
jgi:CO dehydrogenase/acetyl-CoA synthase delta subunit